MGIILNTLAKAAAGILDTLFPSEVIRNAYVYADMLSDVEAEEDVMEPSDYARARREWHHLHWADNPPQDSPAMQGEAETAPGAGRKPAPAPGVPVPFEDENLA